MHGLPNDFDSNVFVGTELNLICFSVNTVSFHFEDKVMITVESPFEYSETQGPTLIESLPLTSSGVMILIGKTVGSVTIDSSGNLALVFEDGSKLKFFDTKHYEAYHITIGDKEFHI
jgi:hypothetical protein